MVAFVYNGETTLPDVADDYIRLRIVILVLAGHGWVLE